MKYLQVVFKIKYIKLLLVYRWQFTIATTNHINEHPTNAEALADRNIY